TIGNRSGSRSVSRRRCGDLTRFQASARATCAPARRSSDGRGGAERPAAIGRVIRVSVERKWVQVLHSRLFAHVAGGMMADSRPDDETKRVGKKLDPEDALAVDATPDEVRTHGDADETESVLRNDGAVVPVDE